MIDSFPEQDARGFLMLITKKEQYALRAVHELALVQGDRLLKVSEIAEKQMIPVRFLEVILSKLRRSGIVSSKRGYTGGYALIEDPEKISVGDVFRGLQKDKPPITCAVCDSGSFCPYMGDCTYQPMWNKVQNAIGEIYDNTTIRDLMFGKDA